MGPRRSTDSVYVDAPEQQLARPEISRELSATLERCREPCALLDLMRASFPAEEKDGGLSKPILKELKGVQANFDELERELDSEEPDYYALKRVAFRVQVDEPKASEKVIEELAALPSREVKYRFATMCGGSLTTLRYVINFNEDVDLHRDNHKEYSATGKKYLELKEDYDKVRAEADNVTDLAEPEETAEVKVKKLLALLKFKPKVEGVIAELCKRGEPYAERYAIIHPQEPESSGTRLKRKIKATLFFKRDNSVAKAAAWESDGLTRISDRTKARYQI